ncbi:unnamed protein product [Mycena citricolor]|uniref:Uncharacterized protein n=1 Tax=Mycena citricolor TaxID=2018698 RepID=A0AAD2K838_9AGAR|nr:unnamed protein product [Mycena citricolor]
MRSSASHLPTPSSVSPAPAVPAPASTFFPSPFRFHDDTPPAKRQRRSSTPRVSMSATPDEVNQERAASTMRMINLWSGLAEKYSRRIDEDDIVDLVTGEVVKDRGVLTAESRWDFGRFYAPSPGEENTPTGTDEDEDGEKEDEDEEDDFDELDLLDRSPRKQQTEEISIRKLAMEFPLLNRTDPVTDSWDFEEFMKAERQRREAGDEEDEDEGEDEEERTGNDTQDEKDDEGTLESNGSPPPAPARSPSRRQEAENSNDFESGDELDAFSSLPATPRAGVPIYELSEDGSDQETPEQGYTPPTPIRSLQDIIHTQLQTPPLSHASSVGEDGLTVSPRKDTAVPKLKAQSRRRSHGPTFIPSRSSSPPAVEDISISRGRSLHKEGLDRPTRAKKSNLYYTLKEASTESSTPPQSVERAKSNRKAGTPSPTKRKERSPKDPEDDLVFHTPHRRIDRKGKSRMIEPVFEPEEETRRASDLPSIPTTPLKQYYEFPPPSTKKRKRRSSTSQLPELSNRFPSVLHVPDPIRRTDIPPLSSPGPSKSRHSRSRDRMSRKPETDSESESGPEPSHQSDWHPFSGQASYKPFPGGNDGRPVTPLHDPRAQLIISQAMQQAIHQLSSLYSGAWAAPLTTSRSDPYIYSTPTHRARRNSHVFDSGASYATLPPSSPISETSSSPVRRQGSLVARSRSRGRRVSFALKTRYGETYVRAQSEPESETDETEPALDSSPSRRASRSRLGGRAHTPGPSKQR